MCDWARGSGGDVGGFGVLGGYGGIVGCGVGGGGIGRRRRGGHGGDGTRARSKGCVAGEMLVKGRAELGRRTS